MSATTVTEATDAPEGALDALPHLWNTSARNPAVKARQKLSEERTAFLVANDPGYARDLAAAQNWIGSYEVPVITS